MNSLLLGFNPPLIICHLVRNPNHYALHSLSLSQPKSSSQVCPFSSVTFHATGATPARSQPQRATLFPCNHGGEQFTPSFGRGDGGYSQSAQTRQQLTAIGRILNLTIQLIQNEQHPPLPLGSVKWDVERNTFECLHPIWHSRATTGCPSWVMRGTKKYSCL